MYGKADLRDRAALYTRGRPEFELNSSPVFFVRLFFFFLMAVYHIHFSGISQMGS